MVFLARTLAPAPAACALYQPELGSLRHESIGIVHGDADWIDSGCVRAALDVSGAPPVVWVRLDELDGSPPYLAASLAGAMEAGSPVCLQCPTRDVSRVFDAGTPEAIGSIAAELLDEDTAVVVEVAEARCAIHAALAALSSFQHRAGGHRAPAVLVSHVPLAEAEIPGACCVTGPAMLRFDEDVAEEIVVAAVRVLRVSHVARMLKIAGGRTPLILATLQAVSACDPDAVSDAIDGATCPGELASSVAGALLDACSSNEIRALAVAERLGYWHETFDAGVDIRTIRPWFTQLERNWFWLRPMWRPHLRYGLRHVTDRAGGGGCTSSDRNETTLTIPWQSGRHRAAHRVAVHPPDEGMSRLTMRDEPGHQLGVALRARMLGLFDVHVDGSPVDTWEGKLGPMVLKYLLARPSHWAPRDVLIEAFWPGADPVRGRNRLHVAVSALRRSLASITPAPIVEFSAGRYHIAPSVTLALDIDEFQRHLREARRLDEADDVAGAIRSYEAALVSYGGTFLAEDTYEQWTFMVRESLRSSYLRAMDRLATLLHGVARTDDCLRVCQRVLEEDPCCESAHRLMMRAYAEVGHEHEALRQFHMCCEILERELSASPSRATVDTYLAIRRMKPAGGGSLDGAGPPEAATLRG